MSLSFGPVMAVTVPTGQCDAGGGCRRARHCGLMRWILA